MAPKSRSATRANPLRVITERIAKTKTKHLPYIVHDLAEQVGDCASILTAPESDDKSPEGSEQAVLVNTFKTQVSVLLQDKNPESNNVAVVLVKATIEYGGWKVIQDAGPWVTSLLRILGVSNSKHTPGLLLVILRCALRIICCVSD